MNLTGQRIELLYMERGGGWGTYKSRIKTWYKKNGAKNASVESTKMINLAQMTSHAYKKLICLILRQLGVSRFGLAVRR